MKRFFFIFFLLLIFANISNAQRTTKKQITTSDFGGWKVLNNPQISNDGKYAAFEVNQQKGDGSLIVKTLDSKKEDSIPRGYAAQFSPESDFIVYKIKQPEDSIRSAKKKKLKKEDMPVDSVGIFIFKKHQTYAYPNLKQFALPKEHATWVPFLSDMKKETKKDGDKKEKGKAKSDESPKQLILFKVATGDTLTFPHVTEFCYAPLGQTITFIRQVKDSVDRAEVRSFSTATGKTSVLFAREGTAKKLTIDQPGNRYGFLFSADTIKEKVYALYYGTLISGEPKPVVSIETRGMPIGWSPSENADLSFSENGLHLFLGTAPKPAPEPKDSLLDEEKPQLDVWTWRDRELQPQQKINLDKEKKRTYLAVYLTDKDKFVQLADPSVKSVQTIRKGDGTIALGTDDTPYKLQASWTGRSLSDYYLIDLETGNRQLAVKAKSMVSLSPAGNFVVWYNPIDSGYYAKATATNKDSVRLTAGLPVSFCDERWDMPDEARPYGIAGWSENDRFLFIYDRFDIWRLDPSGEKVPVNATKNYGRRNFLKLRYEKLDPEEEFIDTEKPVIVNAFDERNKSAGYFSADLRNYTDPKMLLMDDRRFDNLKKAKNAETVIWTSEDVDQAPNLWTANRSFEHRHQLSDTNPQQKNFVWPAVRLVQWTSFSGKPLEGLLYYPENINPDRKYPMVVYFYERNADNLHLYTYPAPTRSTVNRTYFTSNDYIVFVPDITYDDGYPGQSAFNAVVSGTQFVCNLFSFVDRNKIGIQGQSWGGYQVAWLVTQTKMFAAAMAGAPVSNMTSAYGGIRWESGLVRQFQYEKSQSRIGGTLWDKPLQFIENSPLFYVPKIETPLLIMHNDNDGAVPWYQGIELFTAMRRLQKPAWMLTYNNEEHNLKADSWANRMDLTVRMKQFFDHFLKGEPEPEWMKYGIPAIKKGKDMGY